METITSFRYEAVIDEIAALPWTRLTQDDLVSLAWAYYYFSMQFRESLEIARGLHPADAKLQQLESEECNTSNLSPWPGVAEVGERMNHDEFMRRSLMLTVIGEKKRSAAETLGLAYMKLIRETDAATRALSIASYEDGGLERVFRAFLEAPNWDDSLLRAFRHFLVEHIKFDSDPEQGHGALSRHLRPDDRILPVWAAFRDLLVRSVPKLVE
jgi:hypothetical protein